MRSHAVLILTVALILAAVTASATTFVVPTDEEMVARSQAIVIGSVEGFYVTENGGEIETVYEIRLERSLKGTLQRNELLRVVTPGGVIGDRGVLVPGAARFRQGEQVLLFLRRDSARWSTTDLTLGKFRFMTSSAGERLLVRDAEDIFGWDRRGRSHREVVRKEEAFLRFITDRLQGRPASHDYEVEASSVTLAADETFAVSANATSYPARTYTDFVNNQPVRWQNMSFGVNFYKRSDQNIAGASDGGVSAIQNGLAAWNNECGSLINLIYAGQVARASANHDAANVVEYNDPQQRVSGSWGGSGTVAITFISFAGTHSFLGESWLNITDADVVFQDGYTAGNASFSSAMTHELGHGIGWRHSNQNHATGGACNSAVEECTTAAIMNSSVSANYGYTLQPWDVNAAQSVYPGGSCGPPPPSCTAPTVTAQPQSTTIISGSSATLSVGASGTAPLSYQWYVGTSGNTASPISGATSSSITVSPSSTTSYWVRVANSCGAANSATATVTVSAPAAGRRIGDINGDGKSDLVLRNTQTTGITVWLMNGTQPFNGAQIAAPGAWLPVATGDVNGDGRSDVIIRNSSTGEIGAYLMAGGGLSVATFSSFTNPGTAYNVVTTADFNRDGTDDIALQRVTDGTVSIWYMGNGVIASGYFVNQPGAEWKLSGSGDFDADGYPDLILQNASTGQVTIWRMQGATILSGQAINNPGTAWTVMAAADVNGDRRADVILQNRTYGHVTVWTMNGYSILDGHVIGTPGTANVVKGRGDFNGDGVYDVVLQNTSTKTVVVWLMSGANVISSGDHTPSSAYELMVQR
jgi:hypothetical protein